MPRKHDKLHDLQGTRPHDRNPEMTPSTLVAGRPRLPKGTTPAAKSLYKRLCKQLAERRALTEADEYLLTLAVTVWDRWQRAQKKLLEEGEVVIYTRLNSNGEEVQVEKPNLNLKIAQDSERQLVAILDRLGLTPQNGSKIKQTRAASDEKAEPEEGTVNWIIAQHQKRMAANDDSLPA